MIDIKLIRKDPEYVIKSLEKRNINIEHTINEILDLDKLCREAKTQSEKYASEQNALSKSKPTPEIIDKISEIKMKHMMSETAVHMYENDIKAKLEKIPNIPDESVPFGIDETSNQLIRSFNSGTHTTLDIDHVKIGELLGGLDFEITSKLCGSRFSMIRGQLARLERAIGQFMLDTHINQHGYEEVSMPFIVKSNALYGTGQLPKFEEDLFKVSDDLYLIPTSEVTLTNTVSNRIVDEKEFPIRLTALTHCFRAEAGSAGKDTRGLIRQHQFQKVELVSIVPQHESKQEHERMLDCVENILKKLDLSYQVMLLCSGDMGFSANKTYDLEVWVPSQKKYREISSVSNCGDFQALRMNARYKSEKKNIPVHTLNGSGVAVGRALVAIIENYYVPNEGINIPTVLQPYMGETKIIEVLK